MIAVEINQGRPGEEFGGEEEVEKSGEGK